MKVLFISVLYMPTHMPSDKRFVRDLIFNLPPEVSASVWAVNDWPDSVTMDSLHGRSVPVYSGPRLFHSPRYSGTPSAASFYSPHASHGNFRQVLELSTTMFARQSRLSEAVRREQPDVIHVTDNWGPVLPLVRRAAGGVPITLAKPSMEHIQDSAGAYARFIRMCLRGCDCIVSYDETCTQCLTGAALTESPVETIPWGIVPPREKRIPQERVNAIRSRYGCGEGDLLAVVSIQSDRALSEVLNEWRSVAGAIPVKTVAAVKPPHWREEFGKLSSEDMFVESGPADFTDLLHAADIMFSPTYSRFVKRTFNPPLTWMEAMVRGTALITSACPGVSALVQDGKNGFSYASPGELGVKIAALKDPSRVRAMQEAARETISGKYDVAGIAKRYVKVWSRISRAL